MKKAVRCDIQQQVTDRVIAQLEQGNLSPWQCPWTKTGENPMPYNWLSRQPYNGINILLLWHAAEQAGYTTNAWLTFRQAKHLGGCVRKGAKSVRCIFYKTIEVENRDAPADAQGPDRMIHLPCMREFSLFNIEQVDGLANLPAEPEQPVYADNDSVRAIDVITGKYCSSTGVQIRHGGDRAYYAPILDIIRLPNTFREGGGYAAVLAHELIHSTGHQNRLDRFNGQEGDLTGLEASLCV